ncbi:MAG: hypothetical protein NZ847_10765 [Acidobacteria bacterium]|nr:hypothetical protein [Acidobacteriota bacterium]
MLHVGRSGRGVKAQGRLKLIRKVRLNITVWVSVIVVYSIFLVFISVTELVRGIVLFRCQIKWVPNRARPNASRLVPIDLRNGTGALKDLSGDAIVRHGADRCFVQLGFIICIRCVDLKALPYERCVCIAIYLEQLTLPQVFNGLAKYRNEALAELC